MYCSPFILTVIRLLVVGNLGMSVTRRSSFLTDDKTATAYEKKLKSTAIYRYAA